MADGHTHLISGEQPRRLRWLSIKKGYQFSCIRNKGALLAVMWSVLISNFGIYLSLLLTPLSSSVKILHKFSAVFVLIAMSYLLYPLLGLLGEKWTRYKVMMVGTIMCCLSYPFLVVSNVIILKYDNISVTRDSFIILFALLISLLFYLGLGMFEANIVQFGSDQLQFASSIELSSFVHWFVWISFFPGAIGTIIESVVLSLVPQHVALDYHIYVLLAFGFVFHILSFIFSLCSKHHIASDAVRRTNPVTLICRVMRYAWKHKQPVRRSAFTYGEPPPSRLDIAKDRYGGPFTTEQVEDVKSFWNIWLIIIVQFGFALQDNTSQVTLPYIQHASNANVTLTYIENVVLVFPTSIAYSVVAVGIPIFQFMVVPCLPRFIPSILKRIWIGLLLTQLQSILLFVISSILTRDTSNAGDFCRNLFSLDNLTIPYYVLLAPQILSGFSTMLIFISGFEFILAQGPRHMQGVLIGLWFMQSFFTNINLTFLTSSLGCYWEYYAVKSGVVFISVICYTIAAYKYKYRQRNELSDVNERVIITQYTERRLDRKEQLSKNAKSRQTSFYMSEDML